MLQLNQSQAAEFIAELAQKCDRRWQETVDQTRFMNELRVGKLKKQTIQLFYKNWGSFVPVINSVYTSAFYRHLWFFVKNVDLMEVYTQKVLDEFGHPSPPAHIQILMSTGKALGLSKEEVLLSPMLPACRALPGVGYRPFPKPTERPFHDLRASRKGASAFWRAARRVGSTPSKVLGSR